MSSVTNNQNIILQAKQNYEKTLKTKVPAILVSLPSKGLVYPKSSPLHAGTIEMRYMTAYDEDILTNKSYIQNGIMFDKLLESLIVTPGVNPADITNFDRDGLIINARINAYGSSYPVIVTDPINNIDLKRTIDLSKLQVKKLELTPNDSAEFDWESNDKSIQLKFKYLSSAESKLIEDDTAISKLMELSITEINGNRTKNVIAEYIKYEMRAADAKAFRSYFLENIPGINYTTKFEGEDGGTFESNFRIGSDLFWF